MQEPLCRFQDRCTGQTLRSRLAFDLQTLCENGNFPFLHEILNYSLQRVLWAAGLPGQSALEAAGLYLRSVLMKITLQVRILSLFRFLHIGALFPNG